MNDITILFMSSLMLKWRTNAVKGPFKIDAFSSKLQGEDYIML